MSAMAVTVSRSVAQRVELLVGRKCAEAAVTELLCAVEKTDGTPSEGVVRANDLFSCFVAVPAQGGGGVRLRVYWSIDDGDGRKDIVRVQRG